MASEKSALTELTFSPAAVSVQENSGCKSKHRITGK
jgi:hypothetical protein